MAVDGIRCLYLETHNFGKCVAFWKQLGWELTQDLGGRSGSLSAPGGGAYIFVEEVPEGQPLVMEPYLNVVDADSFHPGSPADVVSALAPTHWGTRVMEVRDPDGRVFKLEDAGQRGPTYS